MAISVNPLTHVIYVPKADLSLVQTTPTEVRELNMNTFRLWLKDWEDSEEGIYQLKTHNHNTEVTLSGLTYARIIEILDPYTVEFEDGQYTINCTHANHNLADKKVDNQVSLIVNNAAGLISNKDIEFSSFENVITIDPVNGSEGTYNNDGAIGTKRNPSNNINDALVIAEYRGIDTFYITGSITISGSINLDNYIIRGQSTNKTMITMESEPSMINLEMEDCSFQGVLDGGTQVRRCVLYDVSYFNGVVTHSVLAGTITLSGGADAYFLDCFAGTQLGTPPVIDLGGSGQTLVMQNFNGYIKWRNMNDPTGQANASLNAGWLVLEDTITDGIVNIIGNGYIEDYTTGNAQVYDDKLVNPSNAAKQVWTETTSGYISNDTFGKLLNDNQDYLKRIIGLVHENIFIDNPTFDSDGNMTSARLRIYSDPVDVGTSTNVIGTYNITAPGNGPGKFTNWSQIRIS